MKKIKGRCLLDKRHLFERVHLLDHLRYINKPSLYEVFQLFITVLFFIFNPPEKRVCWLGKSSSYKGVVWSKCESRTSSHHDWICWSFMWSFAVCRAKVPEISKHSDTVNCHGCNDAGSILAWKACHHVYTSITLHHTASLQFFELAEWAISEGKEERVILNNGILPAHYHQQQGCENMHSSHVNLTILHHDWVTSVSFVFEFGLLICSSANNVK